MNEKLKFRLPTAEDAAEYISYRQAFLDAGSSMDGTGPMRRTPDPMEWLAINAQYADPATVPEGKVQSTQFVCERVSDGYLYGLSLDSDAMNDLAAAIAPDIKAQNVTFSSGRISVLVSEQGALKSVNISCSGALHLILSDAPASLSAVITPAEREFSIPQPALKALKQ